MIVNSRNAEALRRLTQSQDAIEFGLNGVTGFTLAGVVELIATAVAASSDDRLKNEIDAATTTGSGILRAAWGRWKTSETELGGDIHGMRLFEFFRIRVREDQTGLPYQLFQERFVRSLKDAEFPTKFAEALAGSLVEMTDNVIQHSRHEPGEFSGLAGYHVSPGYMAFSVMDVGQGVFSSLTRAPTWKQIKTTHEALRAAVCQQASSRPDQPVGEGFRTLFRSLTDRNCRLRFRSDDAVLRIEDAGMHRDGAIISSPHLPGLQLSVCCALSGRTEENVVEGG